MTVMSKVFKAYDVRATYPDPLNEQVGQKVGYGIGQWLKQRHGGQVGLVLTSRDHRPAAESMHDAINRGLRAVGHRVIDLGRCDTSFMYFAIPFVEGVLGGVQTTASHNPIEYIGYKISSTEARPVGADTGLKQIQTIAEQLEGNCPEPTGGYEQQDLWADYREHVLSFLAPPKRPLRIFVDACNGMATKLVPTVFGGIENIEIIEENFLFTDCWAHEPNPLVAENMTPTREGVVRHGADLGACFDGDADRCMLVDDMGGIIGCDHLTALLCESMLEKQPGSAIVYDLRSSKVVPETIAARGGRPEVSKVGHVNMKERLRETDGIFGGELSGHFYFKHNCFADSGAITLAAVLSLLGRTDRPIGEAILPLRRYPQSGEINFINDDSKATIRAMKDHYGSCADSVLELDGVTIDRFDRDGWWFNVRASNTEPLLRLNAEARESEILKAILADLTPQLGQLVEGH